MFLSFYFFYRATVLLHSANLERETKIPEIPEIRWKPFSTYHVYHMYIFKTNSIDSIDSRETPSLFRVIPAIRGAPYPSAWQHSEARALRVLRALRVRLKISSV